MPPLPTIPPPPKKKKKYPKVSNSARTDKKNRRGITVFGDGGVSAAPTLQTRPHLPHPLLC